MSSLHQKVSAVVDSMQSGALVVHDGPPLDDPNYRLVGRWIRELSAALAAHPPDAVFEDAKSEVEERLSAEVDRLRPYEAAANKWREALEALQQELSPGSDLPLSEVPRGVRRVISNGVERLKDLERQLRERGQDYTNAVNEKRDVQKQAQRDLCAAYTALTGSEVAWVKPGGGLIEGAATGLRNELAEAQKKVVELRALVTALEDRVFGRAKPGELCAPCASRRAAAHYQGKAGYVLCERCSKLEARAALREQATERFKRITNPSLRLALEALLELIEAST